MRCGKPKSYTLKVFGKRQRWLDGLADGGRQTDANSGRMWAARHIPTTFGHLPAFAGKAIKPPQSCVQQRSVILLQREAPMTFDPSSLRPKHGQRRQRPRPIASPSARARSSPTRISRRTPRRAFPLRASMISTRRGRNASPSPTMFGFSARSRKRSRRMARSSILAHRRLPPIDQECSSGQRLSARMSSLQKLVGDATSPRRPQS